MFERPPQFATSREKWEPLKHNYNAQLTGMLMGSSTCTPHTKRTSTYVASPGRVQIEKSGSRLKHNYNAQLTGKLLGSSTCTAHSKSTSTYVASPGRAQTESYTKLAPKLPLSEEPM